MSFMESFVEDLLNLNLMQEGIFKLNVETFSLNKTFNFIMSMFS